jgi:hypothetical protein
MAIKTVCFVIGAILTDRRAETKNAASRTEAAQFCHLRYGLFLFSSGGYERQVLRPAAWKRIRRPASRNSGIITAIDASGGQSFSVDRLDKDARYFLGKRPVFSSRTTPKRFFEFVRHVRADKDTFPVCHKLSRISFSG